MNKLDLLTPGGLLPICGRGQLLASCTPDADTDPIDEECCSERCSPGGQCVNPTFPPTEEACQEPVFFAD